MTSLNKNQKTVAIFGYKFAGMPPWDPDSINSGIVGSEEAVIYLSQKLAGLGYRVLVFANPPEKSRHSHSDANPRFLASDSHPGVRLDVAIAWRQPWKATELKKRAQKVYLWPHDTFQGSPGIEEISKFDDVFWLSEWQRKNWISKNPGFAKFTTIIGNGINPEQFQPVQERKNLYSCIYASNYARGLEILLQIWPEIKKEFPLAILDIYYGWQHWGLLSAEKEAMMRSLVVMLAPLGIREHGLVSHEEVNRAFAQASLWTYPCVLPETFCITALRAQFAGAIPVIIEGSALQETVRYGFKCKRHEDYFGTLTKAMRSAENITLEDRKKMRYFIKEQFTWDTIANRLKQIFESSHSFTIGENKTVLLAILARNKAHVLDPYLKCISNLDYNKKLMTIYIKTDNNRDNTREILQEWMLRNRTFYHSIIFDDSDTSDTVQGKPHEWTVRRLKIIASIRNASLLKAKECGCDYYFVVDCDNFIAPSTLRDLINQDKPIIAPLLRTLPEPNNAYANFFYIADDRGYYREHPTYFEIVNRSKLGTFKVDVVHCTYLINSKYLDKLCYFDGSDDYDFVIFSRWARNNNVGQYICNQKEYGFQIHHLESVSLKAEKRIVKQLLSQLS